MVRHRQGCLLLHFSSFFLLSWLSLTSSWFIVFVLRECASAVCPSPLLVCPLKEQQDVSGAGEQNKSKHKGCDLKSRSSTDKFGSNFRNCTMKYNVKAGGMGRCVYLSFVHSLKGLCMLYIFLLCSVFISKLLKSYARWKCNPTE